MGAHASSPKNGGAHGGAGAIRSAPREPASPFAATASERESRPPRRCLPLAWSGVEDLSDEEEDAHANSTPAKAPKQLCKDAWEPRPFSRDSTASTMSYRESKLGFHNRPGSASSRPSLPSTASTASLGRRTNLSSRASSSMPSPAAMSSSSAAFDKPSDQQVALTDVKLEDARQRAAKSSDTLQQLLASRRDREGASPANGGPLSRRQMQRSQSTHHGQASSSRDTPQFQKSPPRGYGAGSVDMLGASPATRQRQAWASPEDGESLANFNIPLQSDNGSVNDAAHGGKATPSLRAAGNPRPGPMLPPRATASHDSPLRAAPGKARGPLPARVKAHSLGPRPHMLGHQYLDASDGV
eukprot:gb/GFBE01026387.1/.p1 GENE.gb/GFBE01026387.1/~~gb/GFBE01026387.1/.p1  ORF type:complete len:356 (+),score=42.39 gb/GFBE01026387.1/:1-1068(+)